MGHKRWNANAYHRHHMRGVRRIPLAMRPLLTFGVFAVLLIATAAVTVAQEADGSGLAPDEVGICHATGDETQPYIYLVVARDGEEHGHHAQHEGDKVDVTGPSDCGITQEAAEPESDTDTPVSTCSGSASAEEGAPADAPEATQADETNASDAGTDTPAAEDTETPASDDNETPAADDNETPEATDDADEPTDETDEENATDEPAAPSPCDGDLAVNVTGSLHDDQIVFDVLVSSLGPAEADGAQLIDRLPDVGRAWNVSGPDADMCTLAERELRCTFGDIAAGDERAVELSALHCPHDCGDDITDAAHGHARNDRNADNDKATASVAIDDCPDEDWSWAEEPTSTPAPTEPADGNESEDGADDNATPPADDEGGDDNTTDDNATDEGDDGNATDDGPADDSESDANESTPAPPPPKPDVGVSQKATQDHIGVTLAIAVRSLGDSDAQNVTLADTLPDLNRSWALGGADADACTLDGRYLNCDFGDLAPNATRSIEVRAYTDRMPCGENVVNTVVVHADVDTKATNNRSSAGIWARSC